MFKEAPEIVLSGAAKMAQRVNELATKSDVQLCIYAHKINKIQ